MNSETPTRKIVHISDASGARLHHTMHAAAEEKKDDAVVMLRRLLQTEAEIRACRSVDELGVLLVNEMRKICGAHIAYFLTLSRGKPRVTKVSGSGELDRNAPAICWLERELTTHPPPGGWGKTSPVSLQVGSNASEEEARVFPFVNGYWFPLGHSTRRSDLGVLIVGEQPFSDGHVTIGTRIAQTAGHAVVVLAHRSPKRKIRTSYRLLFYGLGCAALAALFYPVPMTALAPMEVVPQDPYVVAAPVDGVIDTIVAAPNTAVKKGDVIVQYVDTVPRNQLQVAEHEVSVAAAKLRQLQQSSFVDESAKRELAQARAELDLKIAERDYAADTFAQSQVRASRDGIAVYADRKEWVGKPVATGQRILEIADETKVELRASLPVAEVLNLRPGARVRAFLNGDPLRPLNATVLATSHQAKMVEGQGLVYLIRAKFDPDQSLPRPGVRGTAQLFSDKAPLGYYLFRRPLTWIRQKVGL